MAPPRIKKVWIILLSSFTIIFIILVPFSHISRDHFVTYSITSNGFLVDTEKCKIPDIDPFDKSIKHLVNKGSDIKCDALPPITFVENDWIKISETSLKAYYPEVLARCQYEPIRRGASDDVYEYDKPIEFENDVQTSAEYVRVACYSKDANLMYTDFHALLQEVDSSKKDDNFKTFEKLKQPKETLNVIAIGVESMSRLNFIRQMPRTRDFLLNNLGAVELTGYTKVADNTYVNIAPMFAGKYVDELPWNEMKSEEPFDEYNFIWKNFTQDGYYTLWAEDAPNIAIFNYNKAGFYKKPADYYLRPLSLAMESHGAVWNTDHHCIGADLETKKVIDWVKMFVDKYKKSHYFAFSFLTRLTHDDINKSGAADKPHYKFLKEIKASGTLDNSILLYFSDHGARFGRLRETFIGKMEERLPAMFIYVPEWFRVKYPDLWKNLQINQHRLTTPFDVYETLKDIKQFKPDDIRIKQSVKDRGITLFTEIPSSRSCEDASILTHWCTCHTQEVVDVNSLPVQNAAKFMVAQMNNILRYQTDICAELTVSKIRDARVVIPNEKVLSFIKSEMDVIGRKVTFGNKTKPMLEYVITLETSPGGGLFEATVSHQETYSIRGGISRINYYGDQSACIDNGLLKKYCYCD